MEVLASITQSRMAPAALRANTAPPRKSMGAVPTVVPVVPPRMVNPSTTVVAGSPPAKASTDALKPPVPLTIVVAAPAPRRTMSLPRSEIGPA